MGDCPNLASFGANLFGGTLGTAGPYGLTAYNATAGYLTDQIPGYQFDPSLVGTDNSCPLDAHGNLKTPTA